MFRLRNKKINACLEAGFQSVLLHKQDLANSADQDLAADITVSYSDKNLKNEYRKQ